MNKPKSCFEDCNKVIIDKEQLKKEVMEFVFKTKIVDDFLKIKKSSDIEKFKKNHLNTIIQKIVDFDKKYNNKSSNISNSYISCIKKTCTSFNLTTYKTFAIGFYIIIELLKDKRILKLISDYYNTLMTKSPEILTKIVDNL